MKPLAALLLLFIAPLFQIILLTLKIKDRIRIPAGVTAILTYILGIVLPIASMYLVESDVHPDPSGPRCSIISASFLMIGVFITVIFTPVIEFIFFIIRRLKKQHLHSI